MCTSFRPLENSLSDEQLVARIGSGEYELFYLLIKRYQPLLKSMALSMSTRDDEVEDLMQEGNIALFSAVRSYKSQKASFSTYAATCVKNAMIDVLRREGSKRKIPEGMVSPIDEVEPQDNNTPEKIFFDNEDYRILTDSINIELSLLERKVLSAYLSGCSYSEIAKALSVSVKSVDNSLTRIKAKLKSRY
ncbi:MAG: sigma-70 family RNA polymerase sigma factor [Ruminococcaceae bacterium]|nr:sigma-70 family RNA polymerase sigma factor [Oscillospiraceae bacterium]